MPEEGFLRRWARVKSSGAEAVAEAPPAAAPPAPVTGSVPVPAPAPQGAGQGAPVAPPTLAEAAQLTPASDFSNFVGLGVDKDVRRLALKKLFADPHFNVMDRLDMYMDDYNKPDPVSAAMLAGLEHARGVLRRPEEVQAELARLAALDPPEHAAGVVRPVPATLPADDVAAPVAAAEAAGGQEDVLDAQEADGVAGIDPGAGTPPGAGPAIAPPEPAADVIMPVSVPVPAAVDAGEEAVTPTTIARTHSGEARP